jgi:hypothetical protein
MSKRLQVLLDEPEWREVQRAARASRVTVAEWVRQALRAARAHAGVQRVQEARHYSRRRPEQLSDG